MITDSRNHVPCFKVCYVMMLGAFSSYLCLSELCLLIIIVICVTSCKLVIYDVDRSHLSLQDKIIHFLECVDRLRHSFRL
jgi:hypothetical protein